MNIAPQQFSRRSMLARSAAGFGSLAFTDLMTRLYAQEKGIPAAHNPLSVRSPHFAPRAKRVIFLFMHGGPSQVDTFDYKPALNRDHGKPLPFAKPRVQFAQTGNLRRSPWTFSPHGQTGTMVSELFPHVGKLVNDLCFLRALHGSNEAHGGALLKIHTGSDTFVRPSMGSWMVYGLGSENENLPGFITICPTLGHGGANNWSSAFLPAAYQGTALGHSGIPSSKIHFDHISNTNAPVSLQKAQLQLMRKMNEEHLDVTGADSTLEARIASFELAFRMQTEAPDLMSLQGESEATRKMYGLHEKETENFGRQCLLARRFIEKGVRFVQVSHSYKWDQHDQLTRDLPRNAKEVDLPIAGLLQDLKARGLLNDTLVLWGGEFGRTPTGQGGDGRDHHPHAFTMWMAGAGVKPGFSYGITDEYGFYTVDQKVHVHDLHATLLALVGLDHEKLTFRHAGRDFRLTDVHGRVITEILT